MNVKISLLNWSVKKELSDAEPNWMMKLYILISMFCFTWRLHDSVRRMLKEQWALVENSCFSCFWHMWTDFVKANLACDGWQCCTMMLSLCESLCLPIHFTNIVRSWCVARCFQWLSLPLSVLLKGWNPVSPWPSASSQWSPLKSIATTNTTAAWV